MNDLAFYITAFTTLFIIIDPPGLVPVFLAMTQGDTPGRQRQIGLRASLVAAALMLGFLLLGEALLGFIGISMPAFRIAGGLLLFLTALDMLFERRQHRREDNASEMSEPDRDPSVFPLALPIIVGPGAITTIILLAGQAQTPAALAGVGAVLAANLLLVFLSFMAAPAIGNLLGKTGINILTRVLGMLLAALAVQFVVDGIKGTGLTASIAATVVR